MGHIVSKLLAAYVDRQLILVSIFSCWTISDVKELAKRFRNQVFGYALVQAQFESIISFKKDITLHVDLSTLFETLDNDNDGRIDGLELLAGLNLCCRADFEEKARFCFELFDFNLNASLSKKELVVMLMANISGLSLLIGGDEKSEPDLLTLEGLADNAFKKADTDRSGTIQFVEFLGWARSNREVLSFIESLSKMVDHVHSDDSAPDTDDDGDDEDTSSSLQIYNVNPYSDAAMQWKTQLFAPTDQPPSVDGAVHDTGPMTNMELEWAYGVATSKYGGNVRYVVNESRPNDRNCIVYHTGNIGIVFDKSSKTQRFYEGHNAEITSFSVHPSGRIIATADKTSCIHLWDALSPTLQCVATLTGMVKKGIQCITFCPSGERLATVSSDSDRTIAILNCSDGEVLSSSKGLAYPNDVLDIAYSASGKEMCIVGKKRVKFFANMNSNRRALSGYFGHIGHLGKKQLFLCVRYIMESAIVGCASGELYRFVGGACVQVVAAFGAKDPVLSMNYSAQDGVLVTGSKGGYVITFGNDLKEVGKSIDLSEDHDGDGRADNGGLNNAVTSLQIIDKNILIGTKGSDVFEASMPADSNDSVEIDRLVWGHSKGELWGLACHPTRNEFTTTGDDKTLRVWSIRSHEQLNLRILPCESRAVTYNVGGNLLCVGMTNGAMAVLNSVTLKVISTWTHCSSAITDVKFSPNSTFLIGSCDDMNIYIYRVSHEQVGVYSRYAVARGHKLPVLHIDISANNKYIQSNDYKSLHFWDMSGNEIINPSSLRNEKWFTWTCPLGWPVQGIHENENQNNINSCHANPETGVVVVGDKNGNVSLLSYPSLNKSAIHQTYSGHSEEVTCVRFTNNNRHVVSVSGKDRTILLWKHEAELMGDSDDDDDHLMELRNNIFGPNSAFDLEYEVPNVGLRNPLQEAANYDRSTEELLDIANRMQTSSQKPSVGRQWRESLYEPTNWLQKMKDVNPNYLEEGSTDVDLSLRWVHGYRGADCRNNLRYNAAGELVYHVASLGIVYSKQTCSQRFLQGAHTDDILGIAAHPAGQIFATGEAGRYPKIVVWNAESLQTLCRLDSSHQIGIPLLAFNEKGNLLASVGLDENNTLIIHEWEKGNVVGQTATDKQKILCVCYILRSAESPAGCIDIIATGGEKHIKFWWLSGKNVKSQRGIWGSHKNVVSERNVPDILSIASGSPGICVTGTADGRLFLWKHFRMIPGSFESPVPFLSPIQAIWCRSNDVANQSVYITGDKYGNIVVWNIDDNLPDSPKLVPQKVFLNCKDLLPYAPSNPSVRSICVSEQKKTMLIGTQGCEIYELPYDYECSIVKFVDSSTDITCGHAKGELGGLWSHSNFPIFWTTGEDCTLRSWTLEGHKQTSRTFLPDKSRTVCFSSNQNHLAVGLYNGKILIFKVTDQMLQSLQTKPTRRKASNVLELRDLTVFMTLDQINSLEESKSNKMILVVKYSSEGSILAAGSRDHNIYLFKYNLETLSYDCLSKCVGHTGPVHHIDFCDLEKCVVKDIILQSNSTNGELYFWNATTSTLSTSEISKFALCYRITAANLAKDVEWQSFSCPYGWPVQGIWSLENDGCNINAVARSNSWMDVPVIAAADEFGRVRVYNYPSLLPGAPDKCYKGHSPMVTNITFSASDYFCITTGGVDNSIFVWETDIAEELREREALETTQKVLKELKDSKIANLDNVIYNNLELENPFIDDSIVTKNYKKAEPNGGDQFTSTKPWIGAIREPSNYVESGDVGETPRASLELNYVYGYRGWDCRNNLGFADSSSEIVYFIAGVGVVLTTETNTQIHNLEHTDDILCLAVHPAGHCVVTGEIGKSPKLVIWDANTGVTLKIIKFHQKGINCVNFTQDGAHIVSVGMDIDRTVAVHNVATGVIVGSGKIGKGVSVYVIAVQGKHTFLTGGKNHVKFWDIDTRQKGGRVELSSKRGLFGDIRSQVVVSATYLGNDAVTGMSDGSLLQWKGRTCTKMISAHTGAVTSMNQMPHSGAVTGSGDIGPRILSGGTDGFVHIWNIQLAKIWSLDLKLTTPTTHLPNPVIQAIACKDSKLLIGTKTSEIFEVNMLTNETCKRVDGHFSSHAEVWALDKHPTKNLFATASDDMTVRVWDAKARQLSQIVDIGVGARAISYCPDGFQVAVGTVSGRVVVLADTLTMMIADVAVGKAAIRELSYSPNGSMMAVGCSDSQILLLETLNYSVTSVCRGHHSSICHIDFSSCGNYLQSTSTDYELLFWRSTGQQIVSATTVRDVNWHSWTCCLGWPVQGIWPAFADGSDINTVDRSPNGKLIVTGDDFKQIKLFNFPCPKPNAHYSAYKGHSEHVCKVRFSRDGQLVYSVGGLDKAVMQFEVKKIV